MQKNLLKDKYVLKLFVPSHSNKHNVSTRIMLMTTYVIIITKIRYAGAALAK